MVSVPNNPCCNGRVNFKIKKYFVLYDRFQRFCIQLQTFDIKVIERRLNRENPLFFIEIGEAYDLTHENIAMSPSFEYDLLRMKELAIMDILSLSEEQIKAQVKRIELLKGKFNKFESRYYSTYRGLEPDELMIFFSKLKL